MSQRSPVSHTHSHARTFWIVFVILAVVTAIEVAITFTSLDQGLINSILLILMVTKVGFVAAFYMHLKYEPRLYSYIFFIPALMISAFALFVLI